jgi:hypothetical protein
MMTAKLLVVLRHQLAVEQLPAMIVRKDAALQIVKSLTLAVVCQFLSLPRNLEIPSDQ